MNDGPFPLALASVGVTQLLEPLQDAVGEGFVVRTDALPSDGIAILTLSDASRVAELRELWPRLGIVVIADHDRFVEPSLVADAFEAGADAYVGSGSVPRLAAHVSALARRLRHLHALDRVLTGTG